MDGQVFTECALRNFTRVYKIIDSISFEVGSERVDGAPINVGNG